MPRYRVWLFDTEVLGVYAQTAGHAECIAREAIAGKYTYMAERWLDWVKENLQVLPALSWTTVEA